MNQFKITNMKKTIVKISAVVFLLMAANQLNAASNPILAELEIVSDSTTESFKVYGNCGMCKRTIEGSLNDQEGIYSSNWNKETKIMEVNYNSSLISLDEIKKKITAVGYDTEEQKATEETYKGLPGCCQYERSVEK